MSHSGSRYLPARWFVAAKYTGLGCVVTLLQFKAATSLRCGQLADSALAETKPDFEHM